MRQPKNRNGINQNAARKTTARIDITPRDERNRAVCRRECSRPFVQSRAGIEGFSVRVNVAEASNVSAAFLRNAWIEKPVPPPRPRARYLGCYLGSFGRSAIQAKQLITWAEALESGP